MQDGTKSTAKQHFKVFATKVLHQQQQKNHITTEVGDRKREHYPKAININGN